MISPPSVVPLAFRLFGPFRATIAGQPLPRLRTRKGQWLLALLAIRHGRAVDRLWLAGTLWPDSGDCKALHNLRTTLTDLRRALGSEAGRLQSPARGRLAFDLAGTDVDLIAFDEAVTRNDLDSLERAVALYGGPLLEGCAEEWIVQEREIREGALLGVLEALGSAVVAAGDPMRALVPLRRAVAVDPFRESAHRALMEALSGSGNVTEATRVYRELRTRLHRELHTEPDPETVRLYERILADARRRAFLPTPVAVSGSGPCVADISVPCVPDPPDGRSIIRLPQSLTPLVGRERETEELVGCLATSRLVTLTGPGGIGKTRLAIRVAEVVAPDYPDGVRFVDLAPLTDPALLPQAIASALELREAPGRSLTELLHAYLESRSLLMVLDNCEHLVEASARLTETLLEHSSGLRVLSTSRQSLGLNGETVWPTPPLILPMPADRDGTGEDRLSSLTHSEAACLFLERARALQPNYALTDGDAAAVAEICERVEGILLAIEMAAARIRALSAPQIAALLTDRLRLLVGGSRTAPARQRTLKATLDWSFHLLTQEERTLLARLAVFAGGFTLEAAQAVGGGDDFGAMEVLDRLESLVDKSLVQRRETPGGGPRFGMLETVREYALEVLSASGEGAAVQCRHMDHFRDLAETLERLIRTHDQLAALDRFATEHANFRAALAWSETAEGDGESGLRLAGALFWCWRLCAHLNEARMWLERTLERTSGSTPTRRKALCRLGGLVHILGDATKARVLLEECLDACRGQEDRPGTAETLLTLGMTIDYGQHGREVEALLEESIALWRELGDSWGLAMALRGLGWQLSFWVQRDTEARRRFEESVILLREIGDSWVLSEALLELGVVRCRQGDAEAGSRAFEEAIERMQVVGDRSAMAYFWGSLGEQAYVAGDYDRATTHYEESLSLCLEIGNDRDIANYARCLGNLSRIRGRLPDARAHYERSLRHYETTDNRWGKLQCEVHLGHVARSEGDLEAALGHYRRNLAGFRDFNEAEPVVLALEGLAGAVAASGDPVKAARWLGAAEAARERLGCRIPAVDSLEHDVSHAYAKIRRLGTDSADLLRLHQWSIAAARDRMTPEGFAAARTEGRAMSLEEALAQALENEPSEGDSAGMA